MAPGENEFDSPALRSEPWSMVHPGQVENPLMVKGVFSAVLKAHSPRADGGRHGSPASIRLSANCFPGLSKDQGGLFGNPKFPGVRMGWDSPNGAGHPFRVTPSRHSELHQGRVWSLSEFLHSRSLDFAPLQPLALVSPSVIKGWARPGGCCRSQCAGIQSVC